MSALLVLGIFGGGFALLIGARAVRTTLVLRRLRGSDERREHDMERVASYLSLAPAGAALIPERAWNDLDMDEVFQRLDRTTSWPGQHQFYLRLRREDHSFQTLRRFELGVDRLAGGLSTRQRIRDALRPLDERRASALPALFDGTLPPLPPHARWLALLTIAALVCVIGSFWWPRLLIPFFAIVATNLFVRPWIGLRIAHAVPAMRMLPALYRSARTLAAIDLPELDEQTEVLRRSVAPLRRLARAASWLSVEPAGAAELVGYLSAYINLLFLFDISAFVWSEAALRAQRGALRAIYAALGDLDTMQSVATVRGEARPWTRPVFSAERARTLAFTALTHPLLNEPVPNSLALRDRSMLLTGSNMSGKSTFIRTVGVNAVLARTIHTVFAEGWQAPCWAVRTSIGRADSLLEGTSYYRAEVNAIGELLNGREGEPRLVLIDELFRGTNSIERVAGAKAVLSALDDGADLIMVATHDVELLALLPRYAPYHFREEVRDGSLHFDYRLHDGPSITRNALAILELAGYPAAVVADARRTADRRDAEARTAAAHRVRGQ
jgi:hypothetical protein